ncbi:MAG: bifunctional nuclease family protein [Chloroflexi bacterium]|nr:bifunctional nuclease family protein [Chloroflexota bacterium]
MTVDSVRIDLLARHRLLVLKENERERYLPIAVGAAEAGAIAVKLMNARVLRPLTHDLLASVVTSLGGKVTQVLINDVVDGTFFARVIVDAGGRHVEVDSRPSDAIALALRVDVPIFVEESVLARVAVEPEQQAWSEGTLGAGTPAHAAEPIRVEQLAAFREVIERLNLDDLGR